MTIKEHAIQSGINPDTIRKRRKMPDGSRIVLSAEVTADVWQQILEKKNGASGQRTSVKNSVLQKARPSGNVRAAGEHGHGQKSGQPDTDGQPDNGQLALSGQADIRTSGQSPDTDTDTDTDTDGQEDTITLSVVRNWTVDILLVLLAIGHAWLIKYELSESYGTYGQIGGWVAFGFICATVLLSADRTKNNTSSIALVFALVIDAAAVVLHYEHFRHFNAPEHITVAVCAFLGLMSWGALFLFRHKKNN